MAARDRTAASRSEAVSGRTIGPTAHRTIHPATAEGASAVNRWTVFATGWTGTLVIVSVVASSALAVGTGPGAASHP